MKFLVAASLLVSASAFSVAPNTQGASSTVSKLRSVLPTKYFVLFHSPIGVVSLFLIIELLF
jgi:hypothetical protein